jgi:hypothetical protein
MDLSDLNLTERGGTMLTSEENIIAWLPIQDDVRLEVSYNPSNYPCLNVMTVTLTDQQLVDHINNNLEGWYIQKNNLDGELNTDPYDVTMIAVKPYEEE